MKSCYKIFKKTLNFFCSSFPAINDFLTKLSDNLWKFFKHLFSAWRVYMNWLRKLYIWECCRSDSTGQPMFLFFCRFYILQSFINFVRCYWDLIHSHSDCIVNGICDGRHDRQQRSLASLLCSCLLYTSDAADE